MYPDWLQELQQLAGRPLLGDMFHGAEAYLEMWERAYGVPAGGCLSARGRFKRSGVGRIRLGQSFQALLYAAGQPASRPGRSYRYCVAGGRKLSVVFNARGRVAMVVTNARGYRHGIHRGRHFVRARGWVGVTNARGRALRADLRAAGVR
jgi:hypothetical protein